MPEDRTLNNDLSMVFKNRVWLFGMVALTIGTGERLLSALSDYRLSAIEVVQLLIGASLLIGWVNLKPFSEINFLKRVNYIRHRQKSKGDVKGV